jgi:hypothetical protein
MFGVAGKLGEDPVYLCKINKLIKKILLPTSCPNNK